VAQWRSSKHHKLTICATASSLKQAPEPWVSSTGREVPQPEIVDKWYKNYGRVDAYNHLKVGAGKLGWEHRLKAKGRPNFPLFTGLMSMIDANTYSALKHFYNSAYGQMTHTEFREELCKALLHNEFRNGDFVTTAPRDCNVQDGHIAATAKNRRTCVACIRLHGKRSLSHLYCQTCGINAGHFCKPNAFHGRDCWELHVSGAVPKKCSRRS
jgi:hypothetical protein